MSSRSRAHSRSAGFSLAEVLIALAIAAMMTAVLTRFVAGTRANAVRLGEALEMGAIAESLMARIGSKHGFRPGRTDGHAGRLAWRIDIRPVAFTAAVRKAHERNRSASGTDAVDGAESMVTAKALKQDTDRLQSAASANWVAYRVTVAVEAPSGRTHVVDTVRVGPPPEAQQR